MNLRTLLRQFNMRRGASRIGLIQSKVVLSFYRLDSLAVMMKEWIL